jgi:tetratricopeptide (TPR) repeat protein
VIRRDEDWNNLRSFAVNKHQLGSIRLHQHRYAEALEAYNQAREAFLRLNEPGSVASVWHQIGTVHQLAGQPEAAEESYNKSLTIEVQIGNQDGQASTLLLLGILYSNSLQRPEDAVAFCQRAAMIYREIGDLAKEGIALSNLADSLAKLQRFEKARQTIHRAIDCKASFGHTTEPWTSWALLASIETAADNGAAAAEARHQAIDAFLAYRRDGGENQFRSGRLTLAVRQALASGDPAEVASPLQQLAAAPQTASMLPFLTALQAITAGNRDRSLAEDPVLSYDQAAEVLLLIETLATAQG